MRPPMSDWPTLDEWCSNTGATAHKTSDHSFLLIYHPGKPNYRDLWNLKDFRISSACGDTIFLVKRIEK